MGKLMRLTWATVLVVLQLAGGSAQAQPSSSHRNADVAALPRIVILYDAFGNKTAMTKDWGYAALIEYGGKRILFDTGGNPEILAHNAKEAGVDLSRLDFVVMSHRHGDHMGGLTYLLSVNPKVRIYAPKETFGVYGFSLPGSFYRQDSSLPREQRYYDGNPPEVMKFGSAWPQANIELVDASTEILPGFHLVALVSDKPATLELRELSLVIDTPDGAVVVVGCSHSGIDRVIEAASTINPHIHMLVGGLHLVVAKDDEIQKIVSLLHETYKVDYVAPGHCTGEPTFAALKRTFGKRYVYAGLGTSIALVSTPYAVGVGDVRETTTTSAEDLRAYNVFAMREQSIR